MVVSSERLADRVVLALMVFQLQLESCLVGHSCSSWLLVHTGKDGPPGWHPATPSPRPPVCLRVSCEGGGEGVGRSESGLRNVLVASHPPRGFFIFIHIPALFYGVVSFVSLSKSSVELGEM